MENPYLYIVILLSILAVGDLIVGVSNDAVNFLNSAIGSKVVSFKTLMIIASLGVALEMENIMTIEKELLEQLMDWLHLDSKMVKISN